MKPGFAEALAAARAGQAPVPQRQPDAGTEPMSPLHEQLLASVQAREEHTRSSPSTYVPNARAATAEKSYLSGAKSRGLRRAGVAAGKGTIEEVLSEEAGPVGVGTGNHPVLGRLDTPTSVVDARAIDEEEPLQRWPHGQPPQQVCPVCAGRGFIQLGPKMEHCRRCNGEGRLPGVDLSKPYLEVVYPSRAERAEAALAAEHTGEQALPWEDPNEHLVVDVSVGVAGGDLDGPDGVGAAAQGAAEDPGGSGEDSGEASGTVGSDHTGLAYDLPTNLFDLPAFCYVAGPAGTGKTWMAKAWSAQNPEAVVLAATTGIAAVNLGEGTTINALLRYYDTASLTEAYTGGWLEGQLKRLRGTGLQRIVLDEVSMLSGDQLTILCRALDNVNADRGEAPELGLVLVGDFAQLAPVKEPFAFESAEWDRFARATYPLTTIRRQADRDFIEALQAVRRGEAEKALTFFGPRLETTTHPLFDGTTILAKNEAVDKYNQLRLDKVHGEPVAFPSSRWGKVRSEWGAAPKPPRDWGIPDVLHLKVGALVMVLANRNLAAPGEPPEYLYVNGDLGTLLGEDKGAARVELQRTGEVVSVVPCERSNVIPLEPGRRKRLREDGHPERVVNGKQEAVGGITYTPLRLAWASTVHKSQGLSLDRVQLNIRDPFWSQGGMLYVGLSRARTAEGLRVVGTPEGFRARCTVGKGVEPWL